MTDADFDIRLGALLGATPAPDHKFATGVAALVRADLAAERARRAAWRRFAGEAFAALAVGIAALLAVQFPQGAAAAAQSASLGAAALLFVWLVVSGGSETVPRRA